MKRTRHDWRKAVLRSKRIHDSTRVLLLYLADYMKDDRMVSVPRAQVAEALGRSERRVAERYRAAQDAGFLVSVAAGCPGRTAVYQGTFPDQEWVTGTSTHKGADGGHPFLAGKGADGGHATSRPNLTLAGSARARTAGSRSSRHSERRIDEESRSPWVSLSALGRAA